MALAIRTVDAPETFDLGGQSTQTLQTLIEHAFREPFSSIQRVTLVTGAGKLGRQKYDPAAAKIVTSTLLQLGFVEDRGASAVIECAGSYKSQHDTGKNLKTVVVFPKVEVADVSEGLQGLSLSGGGGPSLLPTDSPAYKIVMANNTVLERMLQSKCPSWSQKKEVAAILDDLMVQIQSLDTKLMHGTVLTAPEQDLYDTASAQIVEQKQQALKDLMHHHVDTGQITAAERTLLLNQVQERVQALDAEITASVGKPVKLEKLHQKRSKLSERKDKLSQITPQQPTPLKNHADMMQLRKEMIPLLEIQKNGAGRLLSVKESQAVGHLEELQAETIELEVRPFVLCVGMVGRIGTELSRGLQAYPSPMQLHSPTQSDFFSDSLQQASRGWFESDEAFDARLLASRKAVAATAKTKKSSTKSTKVASGGSLPASAKWVVPGGARGKKTAAAKPKSQAPRGGGVFAAMMMDSDSD